MDRRTFLKTAGALAVSVAVPSAVAKPKEAFGVAFGELKDLGYAAGPSEWANYAVIIFKDGRMEKVPMREQKFDVEEVVRFDAKETDQAVGAGYELNHHGEHIRSRYFAFDKPIHLQNGDSLNVSFRLHPEA